jgi:hypothetical protein
MRFVLVLLTAAAIFPALAASERTQLIPQQFRGEWHAEVSRCGSGEDESFLLIGPTTVTYYESTGPVKAAVMRERALALIIELSGEGETWLATAEFELSPDGRMLTSHAVPGEEYVRYRCSSPQERPNNSFKPKPLRGSA